MNLAENLDRTSRARGRSAALVLGEDVTSFATLDRWSRGVAGLLVGRGVGPGDRVGLVVPGVPELAALYYGVLRLGAVAVPLHPLLPESDLRDHLAATGVCLVVVWEGGTEAAEPSARALGIEVLVLGRGGLPGLVAAHPSFDGVATRERDDTAVIVHTSGTTGRAKPVALTHGNLVHDCEVVVNDLLRLTTEDVVLAALPLSHSFGQTAGLNAAVRAGACLVLLDPVDGTSALRTLAEQRVSVMVGTSTTYAAMASHRPVDDRAGPRVCVSVGAALPVEVLLGFEEAFGCSVLETYGLTEASPLVTFNRPDFRRVGSAGTPGPGAGLRVLDAAGEDAVDGEPGELVVRGPHVMKGYWGRPDDTATAVVDGWLHTGDLGLRDEDGFYYVIGRLREPATTDDVLTREMRLETRA